MSISVKGKIKVPRRVKDAVSLGEDYEKAAHLMVYLTDVEKDLKREKRSYEEWLDTHKWMSDYFSKEEAAVVMRVPANYLEESPDLMHKLSAYWDAVMIKGRLELAIEHVGRSIRDVEHTATVKGLRTLADQLKTSEGLLALSMQDPTDLDVEDEEEIVQ